MTYFLFGTLWSVLFWVGYFTLSLFVTIRILKIMPQKDMPAYNYITQNGEPYNKGDVSPYIVLTTLLLLLWPIVLSMLLIAKLFTRVIWPSLRKAMIYLDQSAPTITFEKPGGDTE